MSKRALMVVVLVASFSVQVFGTRYSFVPDWTFKGSTLAGWRVLGQADWKATNGELVGVSKSADGGWLLLDKSLQDVEVGFDFKVSPGAKTGVLLRAEKTDNGYKGVFVSLTEGDVASYAVTLDDNGKELTRERLRNGGGLMRVAPEPNPNATPRGGGGAVGGRGAGGGAAAPAAAGAPAGVAGGGARGGRGRGAGIELPNLTEPTGYKATDWNDIDIVVDANIVRLWLNKGGGGGGAADEVLGAFGPVGLYVGGAGEVRFRDVSYKDLSLKEAAPEKLSPNFRMTQLTPFYYSFASAAADFDRDGNMDIVSGPFIFMGPDFTKKREFYLALATRPGVDFSSNWLEFAGDFTGDGWPDVLLASTSNTTLYVNPKSESRRWDSFRGVIPPAASVAEVSVMKDIDGDGKPDFVYMSGGAIRWAKPDPEKPTGPWLSTQVGDQGTYVAHGIGAGDVNGD